MAIIKSNICQLLYRYGFGHAWTMLELVNSHLPSVFKHRIINSVFRIGAENTPILSMKSTVCINTKILLNIERYLTAILLKKAIIKFWCSNHGLHTETGCHDNTARQHSLCTYCIIHDGTEVAEDELL